MQPPTLEALTRLALAAADRTVSVRLPGLDPGDHLIAFVRTLSVAELDAFDYAVAAGESPRVALVAATLCEPNGRRLFDTPEAGALLIGDWAGWVVDALFGAALELNHLVERGYRTYQDAPQAPNGEGVATSASPGPPPSVLSEPERERVARKVTGIMRTLESVGAFRRVSGGPDA
jgi:hypothetical protein